MQGPSIWAKIVIFLIFRNCENCWKILMLAKKCNQMDSVSNFCLIFSGLIFLVNVLNVDKRLKHNENTLHSILVMLGCKSPSVFVLVSFSIFYYCLEGCNVYNFSQEGYDDHIFWFRGFFVPTCCPSRLYGQADCYKLILITKLCHFTKTYCQIKTYLQIKTTLSKTLLTL